MKKSGNIETIFFKSCDKNLNIKFETWFLLVKKKSQKLNLSKFYKLSEQIFVIELVQSIR